MFEKTLTDVVNGIRASKRDTALYISQCIAEIKTEINSSDMHVKANALQKLTFLQMMGYSMSWASFASIEVMSSPRFAHKRIGYLAASQGFTQDTDVILLTTNLLKKELRGAIGGGMQGVYEAGLAVNCTSNIVTDELARDLLPELTNLTSHPQPYLRKKAILCLFKVFVKYPQALRLTFSKIQQCVQDPDSSVISCAVNVITELSDKNPKNYLHMAPAFFELLTKSSNNWMLIKVVKLLGSLVPEEPRLARKLLEPLAAIVRNTQAKSLLYEAVYAITLCLPYCRKNDGSMPAIVPEIVVLCAQTLRDLVEQEDQNLKYLGLVGFGSLMQSHPRVLSAPDYRPLILECLSDQDVTIRSRALELLSGMTSRKNIAELVTQLLDHVALATGAYKHDLVAKIVAMCSSDKYALVQDFAWYLDVLFHIGHMRGVERHGDLLRAQVTDVALRVLPVRPYAVRRSIEILLEREVRVSDDDPYGDNGRGKHIMPRILPALAWIIGEYSELIREAIASRNDSPGKDFSLNQNSVGTYHAIIQALVDPEKTQRQPTSTHKVFVQAAMKVLAAASADEKVKNSELEACLLTIQAGLWIYTQSTDVEVLDRAFSSLELLKSLDLDTNALDGAPSLTKLSDNDSEDEDDLLGMGDAAAKATPEPKSQPSLASRLRDSSTTLNYILKPSPMKPMGAKLQKKKRDAALGTGEDLKRAIDVNVFREFIDEEIAYRRQRKLTMESVCFTQQKPLKHEDRPAMRAEEETSVSSSQVGVVPSLHMPADSSTSFQKPPGGFASSTTTIARPRHGDPFYLDSGPASSTEDDRGPNRFGTIQLGDSDDEQDRPKKVKRRKEKKEKRPKQNDSSLLSGFENPTPAFEKAASVEVYSSDDDEEDEGRLAPHPRKKGPGKEFAGLAQVDLTTPLREEEVMPERKHRVVPEIKVEAPTSSAKQKKKSKKTKKAKAARDQPAEIGDLLDLGGFGGNMSAGVGVSSAGANQQSSNPINTAFDDLLGLEMPPPPKLPTASGLASSTTEASTPIQLALEDIGTSPGKAPKRPWMKGSIKSSSGSTSAIDWSLVHLRYRAYRTSQGDGLGAMLSICVDNRSSAQLSNLSLSLKGVSAVQMGSIAPGGTSETGKIGPFAFSSTDDSEDVKGSLQALEGSVNVKLVLPASFHLRPEENLSLDQIAEELASPGWSSHSCRIDVTTNGDVKQTLRSFLRAAEVTDASENSTSGTFACRSNSGAGVRCLVKVKERSVKIDVKATNSTLGKAISSDMKRIQL